METNQLLPVKRRKRRLNSRKDLSLHLILPFRKTKTQETALLQRFHLAFLLIDFESKLMFKKPSGARHHPVTLKGAMKPLLQMMPIVRVSSPPATAGDAWTLISRYDPCRELLQKMFNAYKADLPG